jgi:hypothetical protein
MYRDEVEAVRARLATLEAELAGARHTRRELEARAAAGRQRRRAVERSGDRPAARLRWLALGLGVALIATLTLGLQQVVAQNAAVRAAEAGSALARAQLREQEARVAVLERELEAERRRCTAARPTSPPERSR